MGGENDHKTDWEGSKNPTLGNHNFSCLGLLRAPGQEQLKEGVKLLLSFVTMVK